MLGSLVLALNGPFALLQGLMLGIISFQTTPTPAPTTPGVAAAVDSPVVQMLQVLLGAVTVLWDFVKTSVIPPDAASINIIHIAIWVPVTLGLLSMVIAWGKGMWSRRKSGAA